MELRDSRICGTGEFRNAKFPAESRTSAPQPRITPGSVNCSWKNRREAGRSSSTNSTLAKSRNSSRRLRPTATVTCNPGSEASCGRTLRMYVRPPPALAARKLTNRRIIGSEPCRQGRTLTKAGLLQGWSRAEASRVQDPPEQRPGSRKRRTCNNPARTASLRSRHEIIPQSSPWREGSQDEKGGRGGKSTPPAEQLSR